MATTEQRINEAGRDELDQIAAELGVDPQGLNDDELRAACIEADGSETPSDEGTETPSDEGADPSEGPAADEGADPADTP